MTGTTVVLMMATIMVLSVQAQAADPVAGPTSQPADVRRNPALNNLPANTWVKLTPDRNPVARSYSGICCGDGYLFYFGGGHGSHPGNDVELYDVAANRWIQATEVESWKDANKWAHVTTQQATDAMRAIGGGSGASILSPKGRPLTRHTYQMHCWFPEEGAFYSILNGLWAFDPVKRQWTQIVQTGFKRGDVHTQNLAYDPELKTIFTIVSASEDRGIHVFDRQAKTWARKYPIPTTLWSEVYSTYDCDRKQHVVFCGHKWWSLDMSNGQMAPVADLGEARAKAAGLAPLKFDSLSIEYDPDSRQTIVGLAPYAAGRQVELWAYQAERDRWSPVAMQGQSPRGFAAWDMLAYDPVHRCMFFVNALNVGGGGVGGQTDGVFAFRVVRPPQTQPSEQPAMRSPQ